MTITAGISPRKAKLLKNKELRDKYFEDQLKIGLRNQLRSLRDARNLTQGELAELIGTKQSVISRLERDPIRVGMPTFLDIARVLDVGFVARFESIDSIVEWYDNLTQRKMTPRKSLEILEPKETDVAANVNVDERRSSLTLVASNKADALPTQQTFRFQKTEMKLVTGERDITTDKSSKNLTANTKTAAMVAGGRG